MKPEAFLRAVFDAALAAAAPQGKFVTLPAPPKGRTIVLGAGKAAASMAAEFERVWERPVEGLVVTRYGHAAATRFVEVVEAGHPVPDAEGEAVARRILALAAGAGPDDLVVFLGSGGASALLSLPLPGLTLEDKRAVNLALLRCGAPIGEMNAVRKTLSAIKAGRLAAAAAPAPCVTYLISDVPGDDPGVIGSGPTVAAGTDVKLALAICARRGVGLAARVRAVMIANPPPEITPGPVHMLATPQDALEAAAAKARALGVTPHILGANIEGEAREVARVFAGLVDQVRRRGQPFPPPCLLISGGETTVTVRGDGRGGRNAEFLLGLALALEGAQGVHALACDTDGIDGTEDNAGAWIAPDTLARIASGGVDARSALACNDALTAFEASGQVVRTGPTLTNVNDFRAILITGPA